MTQIPDWFLTSIRDGIAGLFAMSLEGSPSGEMLPATAKVWASDLWSDPRLTWNREWDADRIPAAFQAIRRHARRWPAQADFWQHLPERKVADVPALPSSAITPEDRARNLAKLDAAMREFLRMSSL